MRHVPLVQHWGSLLSSRKINLDFSEDIDSGSERGDKLNKCIGGIHTCNFLFVYTHMYILIHYFVLWPCGMPIFVTLFVYIYNINQVSNFYIYGLIDLGT